MSLLLDEDQQLLKQTAAEFVKKESPLVRVRQYRDGQDPLGFSREIWSRMAELGFQAILIPESYGGLGMGYKEMACVMEECGRNLVPEPLLSTVLLAANAVLLAGNEAQKKDLLGRVVDGSLVLALAYQEKGSRYDLCHVATTATRRGNVYTLNGQKTLVLDGHAADQIIVSTRTSGDPTAHDGVTLFVIDRQAPGMRIARQSTMHLRNTAMIELNDVEVDAGCMLGEEGSGAELLGEVIDRATVGLCAEMLGSMQAALEMTLDYLKTRKQFGVLIGTFQALKHRAATMYIKIELARSAVAGACEALDEDRPNRRELVSVAKARCSDTAVLVGYEGIQMHGGIGMTDEHDIGLYAKRARGCEITFGDSAWHRDRFAALQGF